MGPTQFATQRVAFSRIWKRKEELSEVLEIGNRKSLKLPNALPNSFDITQFPLGGFFPPGVLAAA